MPADAVTVAAIADRYVEERCALIPIEATLMGVAGHDHELGDLSPAGVAATEELLRRTLAGLARPRPPTTGNGWPGR